ncbi:DUF2283 domain-containing protein [Geoglobus acetivorans]|nr:DUF2283 domain-containing protein [Geoglobus acetivorans]
MFTRFKKGKAAESEPLANNVILDLDENGDVVGIASFCQILPSLAES